MMKGWVAFLALLVMYGCSGKTDPTPTSNQSNKPVDSVTMDKPTEERTGTIELSEAAEKGGFLAYPGFEQVEGDTFKRNDGGAKDELKFVVNEPLSKVSQFFKNQGLDAKITGTTATALGMTKKNAQLMVIMVEKTPGAVEVTIKSLRY
jgi:hypothetical protein